MLEIRGDQEEDDRARNDNEQRTDALEEVDRERHSGEHRTVDRNFFDGRQENINNSSAAFMELEQGSGNTMEQLEYGETIRDKADEDEDTSSQGCGLAFEYGDDM
ncbi:hypothetical protein Ancab_036188, partial [Ancistrocladus abbreviatus]